MRSRLTFNQISPIISYRVPCKGNSALGCGEHVNIINSPRTCMIFLGSIVSVKVMYRRIRALGEYEVAKVIESPKKSITEFHYFFISGM